MTEAVVAAGLCGFALALAVEALIGRAFPGRPSAGAFALRVAAFLWLYGLWIALWGEPWRAAFGTVATILVMTGLSAGKRAILGEPLAFSDMGLIPLILRHPRLYLLEGWGLAAFWAVVAACLAAVVAFQPADPVLPPAARAAILGGTAAAWLLLPRLFGLAALAGPLRRLVPAPDIAALIGRYGLLAAMMLGWLRWAGDLVRPIAALPHDGPDAPLGPDRVVAVQLESFVDPAATFGAAMPMPGLEAARARALAHGPLAVPAYGAFTMRTEHAVLTGLPDAALGFRAVDPYLSARFPPPTTLASLLAARGWRTRFMHPFHARFFGRRRIVPRLGFAETEFLPRPAPDERDGPYMADAAFARRIVAAAASASGPILIAGVTMENHGPFSPRRGIGPTLDREQHAHHLANTDRAIAILVDGLAALPGRTLLCLWGDHPPILDVLAATKPRETVYAVLLVGRDVAPAPPSAPRPLSADALGRLLQRLAVTPAAGGSGA